MKKGIILLLLVGLLVIGSALQAQAMTISMGEYRFVVAEAYSQIVDPGNGAVGLGYSPAGMEAFQSTQWAIARMNEVQKKNPDGTFSAIWTPGNTVPEPPSGTTDQYLSAVFGSLSYQVDMTPAALGIPGATNTGLTYNTRQHVLAPATVPAPPAGTGLSHPFDYVNNNAGPGKPYAQNVYFEPSAPGIGSYGGYLKLYSTQTDVFNADVVAGIGGAGGAFGSFAPNTIAGTLLLDALFDPFALFNQEGAIGDSISASSGIPAVLRSIGSSDTETGINAFFQTEGSLGLDVNGDGFGAWDLLFDSNSPSYYGADGNIDFTARALPGSPYLQVYTPGADGQPGVAGIDDNGDGIVDNVEELGWLGADDVKIPFTPNRDPITQYRWDFRDTGQALVTNPIPEPSTMLLLGIGLLGLGAYGRKRFKR